eukprot:s380_g2.t1
MARLLWLWAIALTSSCVETKKPNILFILADDLGFNDVSFHGSPQIPTPNIDELARTGVTLNNYHVQPVCSPTRSTILSGRHVSHTGIYLPITTGSIHLNLSYSTLPKFLGELGYETHMVGKWHIGLNQLAALPTSRGCGRRYLWGAEDYYTHMRQGGFDLLDGTRSAFEYYGTHSTGLWVQSLPVKECSAVTRNGMACPRGPRKVVQLLTAPPSGKPFFIYLAFQNVHWPLEAPPEYMRRFDGKTGNNSVRQSVCALASALDDAVGEDTLIIFASDNGGPTNGDEGSWSSNYPLRGGKNSLWEGGTRVAAAIRGPGISPELVGTVSYHKVHAADWLPTLFKTETSRNWPRGEPGLILGDGIDVWDTFSKGLEVRKEVLLEAHPEHHWQDRGSVYCMIHGNALIVGDWKIIRFGRKAFNPKVEFGWVPPPGQEAASVDYQIACKLENQPSSVDYTECEYDFCLFNVTADPCEYHNLAKQHPDIVQRLTSRLAEYQRTALPQLSEKDCGCEPVIVKGAWRPTRGGKQGHSFSLQSEVRGDRVAGLAAVRQSAEALNYLERSLQRLGDVHPVLDMQVDFAMEVQG